MTRNEVWTAAATYRTLSRMDGPLIPQHDYYFAQLERDAATRLRKLREARGLSQSALGRLVGMRQQQVHKIETGESRLTVETLAQLAAAFDLPAAAVLGGVKPRMIPISGRVGANPDEQIVFFEDAEGGGEDEMEAPPGVLDGFAVEVRGNSMVPRYFDRDRIVCRKLPGNDPRAALQRDCAVRLLDGRTLLKRIESGSRRSVVTLRSYNPTFPILSDVHFEWLAPVIWIHPR
jgi:transcriptional regulator with XRE-family HTH domain